jgi:hypothetical protein
MYRYVCQMFYKDRLYSGHYWKDYSLARACREMDKLCEHRPGMRFELTDYATGAIIKTVEHTIPKQERTYAIL